MFIIDQMFPNVKFLLIDPMEHVILYPNNATQYDHGDNMLYYKFTEGNRNRINSRVVNAYVDGSVQLIDRNKPNNVNARFTLENIADTLFKTNHRYYILEDYFTNDLADLLGNITYDKKVLFCSDVRSNMFQSGDAEVHPGDIDILWNSSMQYNWLQQLKPILHSAMLKFRTPFFEPADKVGVEANKTKPTFAKEFNKSIRYGINFIANYQNNKFVYFDNKHIYVQAFPGETSTETRLVINNFDKTIEYDHTEYEEKMFYHNRVTRIFNFFKTNEPYIDTHLGIDYCGDCASMICTLTNYYKKFNIKSSPEVIKSHINDIMYVLRRNLKHNTLHGRFYKPWESFDQIMEAQPEIAERYCKLTK
jgi:hypothetical protein